MTVPVFVPAPPAPQFRTFQSRVGRHLHVIAGTRIYDLPSDWDDSALPGLLSTLTDPSDVSALEAIPEGQPQQLSLNVSSSCNLSCSYCYAGRGGFEGKQPNRMTWKVARAAIDQLLSIADPARPVTIGFLGGEPFVARDLLHRVVAYAAAQKSHAVGFSVTTNGTLLSSADIDLLRAHPFAVTVSVDGGRDVHDRQRPLRLSSGSSFDQMAARTADLITFPGKAQVSARATIKRHDLDVRKRFSDIAALGFREVGVSPLRPPADGGLQGADWATYLENMRGLAEDEIRRILSGEEARFSNLVTALNYAYRGFHMPFSCGAGANYFSVAADGRWYACHRAVGQEAYALGDSQGIDARRQSAFLTERHVHAQTDCQQCWARYLCSGGCHQEAADRNVASCDFIRGWLDTCLSGMCEIMTWRPTWFASPGS